MAQQPVEMILVRQLAGYLSVPVLVMDAAGHRGLLQRAGGADPRGALRGDGTHRAPRRPIVSSSWATIPPRSPEDAGLPIATALKERRAAHARRLAPAARRSRATSDRGHRVSSHRSGGPATRRRGDVLGAARTMNVTLYGVRGSLRDAGSIDGPVRRQHVVRARDGTGRTRPRAGRGDGHPATGARAAAGRLPGRRAAHAPPHGPLLGLGFFGPLYDPGMEVHIWGPASATLSLEARLRRYLSPPLFPVFLRDVPCRLELHHVVRGRVPIGPFRVTAARVCHPGPTVGYRIETETASLAYLPDHEPALGARRFPLEPEWTSGFDLAQRRRSAAP